MVSPTKLLTLLALTFASVDAMSKWRVLISRFAGDECEKDTALEKDADRKYEFSGHCLKWKDHEGFNSLRYASTNNWGSAERHGDCYIALHRDWECSGIHEFFRYRHVNTNKATDMRMGKKGTCLGPFNETAHSVMVHCEAGKPSDWI